MQAPSEGGERSRPLRRRIVVEKSDRFHRLSYEPGMELARLRRRAEARGFRIIDLSRLLPDLHLPVEEAAGGFRSRPIDERSLRRGIAEYLKRERNLSLDPDAEVLPLLHVPEGFRLLALAFANPSDVVLFPDPGDPIYRASALVAGAWPISYPLPASRGHLPDLARIEPEAAFRARLLFVSFPNHPTGAPAPPAFFDELIAFAHSRNVIVVHDASLAGARLDREAPISLLDRPGGKEIGVEFGSLVPFHDAGGWRVGYAIGNREILFAISSIAERLGLPRPSEVGAPIARALAIGPEERESARAIFRERVRLAVQGIRSLEWEVEEPSAGFHLWVPVPRGTHALDFARLLLRRAGIVSVPGGVFGEFGEDHVLLSLSVDETAIRITLDRLQRLATIGGRLASWLRRKRLGSP